MHEATTAAAKAEAEKEELLQRRMEDLEYENPTSLWTKLKEIGLTARSDRSRLQPADNEPLYVFPAFETNIAATVESHATVVSSTVISASAPCVRTTNLAYAM